MATKNKVNIISDIVAEIRTGNSDTTAAGLRTILYEILDSYVNVKDGGLVYETPVGYNGLLTLTDPKSFVYKKWVEDYINKSIIDTAANFTANNPILSLGQFGIEIDNLVAVPKFKIGDGVNDWNTLPYANEGSGLLSLAQVLTNGASNGDQDITSIDGNAVLSIRNTVIELALINGIYGSFQPRVKIQDGLLSLRSHQSSSGLWSFLDLLNGAATLKSDVSNNFDAPSHNFNNSVTKDGLELATENFLENLVAGLKFKLDVAAASTANVNIASAPSSIDGVTLNIDDRVLLKNQTSAPENGCYIFNGVGAPMMRAADSDTESKLISATYPVRGGIVNQDTWFTVTNDAITIGSTNIVISQTAGNGTYTVGSYLKLIGNVFDIDFTTFSTTQINEGINKYLTSSNLSVLNHSATLKTSLNDNDELSALDSASAYDLIRVKLSDFWNYIKNKSDSIYRQILDQFATTITSLPDTITAAQANSWIRVNVATNGILTVPPNSLVPIPIGAYFYIRQSGVGTITIAPGSGVTLNAPNGILATGSQYDVIRITKQAIDSWMVELGAASWHNSVTLPLLDSKIKFCITHTAAQFNPIDATTYFFGQFTAVAPQTAAGGRLTKVPVDCILSHVTLSIISITITGSTENSSLYIRINGTDYLITNALKFSSQNTSINGLNIPLAANDTYEIKVLTATWATNPVNTVFVCNAYFK